MVSLAHHWLVGMRGGEKVLEEFSTLFPKAPITTLVVNPKNISKKLAAHPIKTSILQKLWGARFYKVMMPLFPLVVPRTSVGRAGGIVLSTDASVTKGFSIPEGVPHICYCHSPPRYLWDLQKTYEEQSGGLGSIARLVFRMSVPYVKEFDLKAASRVTHFIANSKFVRDRILKHYDRASEVICPPVGVESFNPYRKRDDFYLLVSELVPYKRVDLALKAFSGLGSRLIIIGHGPEAKHLIKEAPPNVTFLGRQPFSVLRDHFERCRAFLYPQIEDFGITAVEAQAAGAPVLAYRAGGALETIVEGKTGLFFDEQSAASLRDAIIRFEASTNLDPSDCRENAERFRPERFREEIMNFLIKKLPDHFNGDELDL